jgi:hypothetical protein
VSTEAVTVTCDRHRRRCELAPTPRGGGVRIRHAGGAADGPLCDSERFTVRREQQINRDGAHAELIVLALKQEAAQNHSAPTGAVREARDAPA